MLDLEDDRTFGEWFEEVMVSPILWTITLSIALGLAGLMFYAGVWGFTSGIALLR